MWRCVQRSRLYWVEEVCRCREEGVLVRRRVKAEGWALPCGHWNSTVPPSPLALIDLFLYLCCLYICLHIYANIYICLYLSMEASTPASPGCAGWGRPAPPQLPQSCTTCTRACAAVERMNMWLVHVLCGGWPHCPFHALLWQGKFHEEEEVHTSTQACACRSQHQHGWAHLQGSMQGG